MALFLISQQVNSNGFKTNIERGAKMLSQVFQYCVAVLMIASTVFIISWMFLVLFYSNKDKAKGRS
jgi:heme/copper-type cytochrome/quinol oxidase subunit 2